MLTKREDWRQGFTRVLEAYRRRPYDEATANCGLFVADCVAAMCGEDIVAKYRGKPSLQEYEAALLLDGFASPVDLIALNCAEVEAPYAIFGDIAVVAEQGQDALGMVTGPHIAVYARRGARSGIGFVPLRRLSRAFRIEGGPS